MRIFTYPDPFKIDTNKELWDVITKHPHFCASETLLQGLGAQYGRESFGILRTVNSLIEKVLGEYVNNPRNDIQMFLEISKFIRNMPDNELKKAFRFNISEVVESVKFLIMLECDVEKFGENLTKEQKILLDIYKTILEKPCIKPFKNLKDIDKNKLIELARLTVNEEVEYICNRDLENAKKLGITLPIKSYGDGIIAINKIISDLQIKIDCEDGFSIKNYDDELKNAKYILSLMTDTLDNDFDKIIIHGVHKITPEMYYLVKLLEKNGIEVIFLINYAKNLPNTYKTWRDVYAWCDTKFEFLDDVNLDSGKKLGVAISNILENKNVTLDICQDVIKFNNLTSFTDQEVRKTFKNAHEKLNNMETQYYAVSGKKSNEILKMYFPEQFREKPFLSYPIGQFILEIYKMWNFDKKELCINEASLCECAVSNIYVSDINMLDLVNKVKLYFADCETVDEYLARIEILEESIKIVNSNNRYSSLKKLSFLSITLEDLKKFEDFIIFLSNIANKLFLESQSEVDFSKHFETLMEIVSTSALKGNILSTIEKSLIDEINDKLSKCTDGELVGNVEDVKDALAFYLSAKMKGDTSNWIVRDFEQIDGAVLLNKKSKAKNYHFALLSNSHMTNQNDDVLSWPLTEDMFTEYKEVNSAIPVIAMGILERRNFLRFSLFYGTFFTKCNIKLSYIEEENGTEQQLYYLLKVLGINVIPYEEMGDVSFIDGNDEIKGNQEFNSIRVDLEGKEMFSICPYKFLQNKVIKSPIEYSNEYHIKYYIANFVFEYIKELFYNSGKIQLDEKIEKEIKALRRLFPFWSEVVFVDIENKAKEQIIKYEKSPNEQNYKRRKENFLIAKWSESGNNENLMNFSKQDVSEKIEEYMKSRQLYPLRAELPHRKVCENCNFSEVCLRNYYDAVAAVEESELDV